VVVDSLSRKYEEEGSLFSLSFIVAYWLKEICQEWFQDPKLYRLIQQLQQDPHASLGYSWHNEDLRYKGNLYLSKQYHFKSIVISGLHASPSVGHPGFHKTYERIKRSFFWEGMKHGIHTCVVECDIYQCNKGETIKTPGTLQPLLIPFSMWTDISMNFIVRLPKSGNKLVIVVVVKHLSKYAHFCTVQRNSQHPP
jgi:hypothetical protein